MIQGISLNRLKELRTRSLAVGKLLNGPIVTSQGQFIFGGKQSSKLRFEAAWQARRLGGGVRGVRTNPAPYLERSALRPTHKHFDRLKTGLTCIKNITRH